MPHRLILSALLAGVALIGAATVSSLTTAHAIWGLYLIGLPLLLIGLLGTGWTWTAMACVLYGTIGLAVDLATVTSILGGKSGTDRVLTLSGLSGLANLSLIIVGGRSFVQAFQRPSHPESRPPNPPSPSSTAAPGPD